MPVPLVITIDGVTFEFPVDFSKLPSGNWPMSYFDDNNIYLITAFSTLFQVMFANLPTVIPQTPNTLWNNGLTICITPPPPYPN